MLTRNRLVARFGKKAIAEINIVPYVDVMLVLLIIFMITTPLLTQGVQVELPTASAKPLPVKQQVPLMITINKKGELFLNIAAKPYIAIAPRKLQIRVAAELERDAKRLVLVRADKKVNYDTVLKAMVLLQQAGVASVGLETDNVS